MKTIHAAWYNLENLFDHKDAARPPELHSRVKGDLGQWTTAVRNKKISQLTHVIKAMFNDAGPDLLGVCEVESDAVLGLLAAEMNKQLPGRDYKVVGHASPDARGIDVSFIIDKKQLTASDTGHQVVIKRTATRDLFWVKLRVKATGAYFTVVGNHWPSRTAGQYESQPFRILAAETASYTLSKLVSPGPTGYGKDHPVLFMGDFNDEPFNRSILEYLRSSRDEERVRRATSPVLYNLMWPLLAQTDPGTYFYGSDWNMLDQFLVTKHMLQNTSKVQVDKSSVAIFRPDFAQNKNGSPHRFGLKPKKIDQTGFSDHYPLTVVLQAK